MLNWISLRLWYFLVAAACAGLLGYALWVQHRLFLDPCPLCIFQRVAFFWAGGWALLAALHFPGVTGRRVYSTLITLGAAAGAALSARHVYLQNLPPDQVPECGPGLSYMMDTLPFTDVLRTVLTGDGSCAEVQWQFLGLSMPVWTGIWFLGLALGTMWITRVRHRQAARAS